jgi:hypothetical protein
MVTYLRKGMVHMYNWNMDPKNILIQTANKSTSEEV